MHKDTINRKNESREVFRELGLPALQNRVYGNRRDALDCPRGDIRLECSPSTGLVENIAFNDALVKYDQDYQNEQALSGTFRSHLQAAIEVVSRHLRGKRIVEVGCGKGFFLNELLKVGIDATGFDPAYDGNDPRIRKELYSPQSDFRVDGIVLRHVLEHIKDPYEFLSQIRKSNADQGLIYIEVPCLEWIIRHRAWFDIFYEHVNYFTQDYLKSIFGTVLESGHSFAGQYQYVVADLATLTPPAKPPVHPFAFPVDFLRTADMFAARIRSAGSMSAVWGASSKGVIFSIQMMRRNANIDMAIDINPSKQGKFMPVSGIKIHSPQHALASLPQDATIYVMNGNYLDEIREFTENRFTLVSIDEQFTM